MSECFIVFVYNEESDTIEKICNCELEESE